MRLIYINNSIPRQTIDVWVKNDSGSQSRHKAAVARLLALRVLTSATKETKEKEKNKVVYRLNSNFEQQLRQALCNGPGRTRWTKQLPPDKHRPTMEQLDEYAQSAWESILHFMVGHAGPNQKTPSKGVVDLLVRTKLMQQESEDAGQITNDGFQFLLKDIHTQVWTFILEYVNTSEQRRMDRDEVLTFLFELSFLELGHDYPVEDLTESQRVLLTDLREFGLVYQKKSSSPRFYPTRLAINLASGMAHAADIAPAAATATAAAATSTSTAAPSRLSLAGGSGAGYIVVESNYRVYAYTTSALQIALLSLFVRMTCRLPNLAVGVITRDSVRDALKNGITAQQMIAFLQQHAHPICRAARDVDHDKPYAKRSAPAVPETVCDQIRLWEAERNRVTYTNAVLYDQWPSLQVFTACEAYAREAQVLLWSDPATATNPRLVVLQSAHDIMRDFIKKRTA